MNAEIKVKINFDPLCPAFEQAFCGCPKFRAKIKAIQAQGGLFVTHRFSSTHIALHLSDEAMQLFYEFNGAG